jgi:hypothetical protein
MEVESEVISKTSSLDYKEDGKPCQSPCKTVKFWSNHKLDARNKDEIQLFVLLQSKMEVWWHLKLKWN